MCLTEKHYLIIKVELERLASGGWWWLIRGNFKENIRNSLIRTIQATIKMEGKK